MMTPRSWRYRLDRLRHGAMRRRRHAQIEREYEEIIAAWDCAAFADRMRPLWDPFAGDGAAKFLNAEVWLREAVFRRILVRECVAAQGPFRVLDLGAGTGYFLVACRHAGDDVLALDLAGEPVYDACIEYFRLPRVIHRIEPMAPLPDLGERFHLVTAFMTCFDRLPDGSPWGAEPWQYLLHEVRERLHPGGVFAVKFNVNPHTGAFYPPDVKRAFQSHAQFRASFFFDYTLLTAV